MQYLAGLFDTRSPLVRGRGLNSQHDDRNPRRRVAPCTGAWIEINPLDSFGMNDPALYAAFLQPPARTSMLPRRRPRPVPPPLAPDLLSSGCVAQWRALGYARVRSRR